MKAQTNDFMTIFNLPEYDRELILKIARNVLKLKTCTDDGRGR